MIRQTFRAFASAVGFALVVAALPGVSYGAGRLPVPGDGSGAVCGMYPDATGAMRDAILLDGIPIAFKYDDFWSYSAHVLDALQSSGSFLPSSTYGTYDFSVGTGTLDVIVFTGANGASNLGVGPSGTNNFEDPAPTPNGSNAANQSATGTWGNSVQPNGPVTVGQVLSYLQEFDPNNTVPVFFIDWNQTGSGDSILASANAQIWSADGSTLLYEWSLDSITQAGDGTYDPGFAGQVYNYGSISFLGSATDCANDAWDPITGQGCAGVTDSGNDYTNLEHNKGSGKADFIVYAPTMDLSMFDPNYRFVVNFDIGCGYGTFPNADPAVWTGNSKYTQGCLTGGFEESFLSGRITSRQVPEPAPLALLGIGVAAMWLVSRRRYGKQKQ